MFFQSSNQYMMELIYKVTNQPANKPLIQVKDNRSFNGLFLWKSLMVFHTAFLFTKDLLVFCDLFGGESRVQSATSLDFWAQDPWDW